MRKLIGLIVLVCCFANLKAQNSVMLPAAASLQAFVEENADLLKDRAKTYEQFYLEKENDKVWRITFTDKTRNPRKYPRHTTHTGNTKLNTLEGYKMNMDFSYDKDTYKVTIKKTDGDDKIDQSFHNNGLWTKAIKRKKESGSYIFFKNGQDIIVVGVSADNNALSILVGE